MKTLSPKTILWLLVLFAARSQAQTPLPLNSQKAAAPAPLFGVPIGGVGAGTFQVNSDGSIGRGMWTNNSQRPLKNLPGCFAAIWVKRGDRAQAKNLALKNAYGLPNVQSLEFQALFPEAFLVPADPALPLQMRLRVFSPLIPHDLRNSSFPAGLFLFELKNPSSVPVEASVLLSWENALGAGGTAASGAIQNRNGNATRALADEQGFFGVEMRGPRLAPGNSASERLQDNTTGEMALMARPPRKEATVATAAWNALDKIPPWWERFAREGVIEGSAEAGKEGAVHTAGAIAVRLTLRPGDYAEIPFAVAWRIPRQAALSGVDYQTYAAKRFPSAIRTAQELLTEYRHLVALTEEPQRRLLASNLPRPLVSQILNSASFLYTHVAHGGNGECGLLREVGEADDKRNGADFASPLETLAASATLASFFPRLNAGNLERLARAQTPEGAISSYTGNLERGYDELRPPQERSKAESRDSLLKNAAAYILAVAQHCLWTEDEEALRFHYPKVQRAIDYLMGEKEQGGEAEAKEREILIANALNAGAKMAVSAGDPAFQKRCEEALSQRLKALGESALPTSPYKSAPPKEGERISIMQAEAGRALAVLEGFEYDSETQLLRITPQIPGDWRSLSAPVFMPRFWGRVEFKPRAKGYLLNFRLDRLISLQRKGRAGGAGGALTVKAVRAPKGAIEGRENAFAVSLGASPIGVSSLRLVGDDVLITFQSPVQMNTGDRLEIELR